jgi:CheY-like chemotaxis protein
MGESLTVLVVEDDRDIREFVRLMLEVEGFRMIEAENGLLGVEAARRHEPDAILMDMSMPMMVLSVEDVHSLRLIDPVHPIIPALWFTTPEHLGCFARYIIRHKRPWIKR